MLCCFSIDYRLFRFKQFSAPQTPIFLTTRFIICYLGKLDRALVISHFSMVVLISQVLLCKTPYTSYQRLRITTGLKIIVISKQKVLRRRALVTIPVGWSKLIQQSLCPATINGILWNVKSYIQSILYHMINSSNTIAYFHFCIKRT